MNDFTISKNIGISMEGKEKCVSSKSRKSGHFYGKNSATGYFRLELLRSPLGTVYSAMSRYKGQGGF